MAVIYANNVSSHLAVNIGNSDILLALDSSTGWPTIGPPDHAWITIDDGLGNIEIVRCTNRNGLTLTIERGQDGTPRIGFSVGARVELRVCRALLEDIGTPPVTPPASVSFYYGGSTTPKASFDGSHIPDLTPDAQTGTQFSITIDGSSFTQRWTAYIVLPQGHTLTSVTTHGISQTAAWLTDNPPRTGVDLAGYGVFNIYGIDNIPAGRAFDYDIEIAIA